MAEIIHAQEGGHWYDRTGRPVFEVPRADGKGMRPATLRDARKQGWVPGTTSIIKCAAAPGLEAWKATQLMMAALTLPRLQDEPETAWLDRVRTDSQEQARKARERGTGIHAAIQGHFEGKQPSEDDWPHVQGAMKAVGLGVWDAERSFAHHLGFGGKVDLSSEDRVIDFKTKEFGPDDKLQTWSDHHLQLAAYREGLGLPAARCAIVYVSVTKPGLARLIEVPELELVKGWQMFKALLTFWQARSGYSSAFEKQAA